MHRTISIVTLIAFLFTPHINILMPLQIFEPSSAYAGIVENIENTCPSDPTQNGKCALIETKVDNPFCKDINGQQICKDWWRKDFKYKCSGAFDPDTILAKVGNQYCDYKNECTEWIDVEKHGGETSCRIYVDTNRPGCNSNSFGYNCIVNDCGDLFQRCSLKQYVKYSDIHDRANMTVDINCDPSSGNCSSQMLDSQKSGIKLGLYTFSCPSDVRKVCKTYSGKVQCPDGRTQVCNKVKTCKQQKTVNSKAYELKSCTANRNMQSYSEKKVCNPYGCQSSTQAQAYKANNLCIKTGETNLCKAENGCSDSGSYGLGGFVRNGGTFNWLGGWNACDWGYAEVRGQGNNTINVHAFATGCSGQCGDLSVNIPIDTAPGTVIGYVYPHWEGSCVTLSVTYDGYDCSGGGCIYHIGFHGMGAQGVNIPIVNVAENFNCYQDSYQDCSFGEGLQCNRLSSLDINNLECVEYDLDVDNAAKNQCKRYIVNYDCPKDKQITECAEYDEVLRCNDGIYPIRDVRTDSYDFSADFSKAMALAQATNELKHVWSGEPYRCESGTWWMFDSMSLGDYFTSKLMSFAFQQLGAEIMSKVGNLIGGSGGCAESLINASTAAVRNTYGSLDSSNIRYSGSYTPSTGELKIMSSETQGVWDTRATLNTGSANSCFAAAGMSIGNTVGLTPEQSSKIIAFMGNPIVQFAAGFVIDMVTSIKNCSTCTDEKCATKYNQYKEYSLISNRLCHQVGNKCTSKLSLGFTKICLRTGYKHCCYNSKFARILVEQAYAQLGYPWGDYDNPQCTNLTFDDLKRLDFSKMDFSEFIEEVTAKMKGKVDENALKQRMQDRIAVP
jgi:conjugal transfer mating pair stabilization protein TraN